MEGFLKKVLILSLILGLHSGCVSSPASSGGDSEFADLDKGSSAATTTDTTSSEDSLEKELTEAQGGQQQAQAENAQPSEVDNKVADDFAAFDDQNKKEEPVQAPPPEMTLEQAPEPEVAPPPVVENSPPPVVEEPSPMPAPEPPPQATSSERPAQIQRIQYRGNDAGGTVAVEADRPLNFTSRLNANTNQFVVEISNAKLLPKARRSLNTRDFKGTIGAIDPYQSPGSTTARLVVQLRPNAPEPVVQAEGNMLLVVASQLGAQPGQNPEPGTASAPSAAEAGGDGAVATNSNGSGNAGGTEVPPPAEGESSSSQELGQNSKLLTYGSLEEFLGSNQKFYGKKISIEINDGDVRDIIKFLSEESGVNMVISEDIKGKVSLKLKQVPWDQALVVIMKSKKLGYSRSGQVLRIATIADLKKEEEDYSRVAKVKQSILPIEVKVIPVSYAKVEDLQKQIAPFLSERGKANPEPRTSSIVVADIQEVIDRVQKLITSLDVPPPQVLIEGKIVEARETFSRFIGIQWSTGGDTFNIGTASRGRQITANLGNHQVGLGGSGNGTFNFSIAALDFIGDLDAHIGLSESNGDVKVLSSPRILTLHNEAAEISQSTDLPIITSQPAVLGGTPIPKVDFKKINLKLSVTPQITNDASVILAVDVNREFAEGVADVSTGARAINGRAAKTKVIVRNGQTAVIGGIYQNDLAVIESKVPGFGDIPIIGWLFKNKNTTNEKNELLIFLTPKIVAQADSGVSAPPNVTPLGINKSDKGMDGQLKSESSPAPEVPPSDSGLQL